MNAKTVETVGNRKDNTHSNGDGRNSGRNVCAPNSLEVRLIVRFLYGIKNQIGNLSDEHPFSVKGQLCGLNSTLIYRVPKT